MLSQERQRLWKEHVCVCLPANHFDVIRLGVKVDQGLPCVHHYILRLSYMSL